MNLRQERMKHKMSIPELSQATRIECDIIRQYEYGTSPIEDNHKNRFILVFIYPKIFFGLTSYGASCLTDWCFGNQRT